MTHHEMPASGDDGWAVWLYPDTGAKARTPWWRPTWYLLRYRTTHPTWEQLGWKTVGYVDEGADLATFLDKTEAEIAAAVRAALEANVGPLRTHFALPTDARPTCADNPDAVKEPKP